MKTKKYEGEMFLNGIQRKTMHLSNSKVSVYIECFVLSSPFFPFHFKIFFSSVLCLFEKQNSCLLYCIISVFWKIFFSFDGNKAFCITPCTAVFFLSSSFFVVKEKSSSIWPRLTKWVMKSCLPIKKACHELFLIIHWHVSCTWPCCCIWTEPFVALSEINQIFLRH